MGNKLAIPLNSQLAFIVEHCFFNSLQLDKAHLQPSEIFVPIVVLHIVVFVVPQALPSKYGCMLEIKVLFEVQQLASPNQYIGWFNLLAHLQQVSGVLPLVLHQLLEVFVSVTAANRVVH